jgi:Asp-tRNA(Asn)/Glu-tRNA(Gln) amidotransferase A subunit family amidase
VNPAAFLSSDASSMADAVRANEVSAVALVQASLERIAATDSRINAFTEVVQARALRRAAQVDASLASAHGERTRELPLLGVPFAVKNLFDIAGIATLAGSKI